MENIPQKQKTTEEQLRQKREQRERIIKQRAIDTNTDGAYDLMVKMAKLRNRVTPAEFQQFMPLFNNAMASALSKDQLYQISLRYSARFCAQTPVEIVDRVPEDENDTNFKVLHVIQPANCAFKPLTDDQLTVLAAFDNLTSIESDHTIPKRMVYGNALMQSVPTNLELESDEEIEANKRALRAPAETGASEQGSVMDELSFT